MTNPNSLLSHLPLHPHPQSFSPHTLTHTSPNEAKPIPEATAQTIDTPLGSATALPRVNHLAMRLECGECCRNHHPSQETHHGTTDAIGKVDCRLFLPFQRRVAIFILGWLVLCERGLVAR